MASSSSPLSSSLSSLSSLSTPTSSVDSGRELIRKLKVLVVAVDWTLQRPVAELGDAATAGLDKGVFDAPDVPVISVFGVTPAGQKTCVHVHGVMPYFFVECPDALLDAPASDADGRAAYLANLATSIDEAWRTSLRLADHSRQIVHRIDVVKATPFYGYHATDPRSARLYLKISVYDPAHTVRLANILRAGVKLWSSVVRFAVYEAHLPYLLQFFVDYNIVGMDYLVVDELFVRFRCQLPSSQVQRLWTGGAPSASSSQKRRKSAPRIHLLSAGRDSPTPASHAGDVARTGSTDRLVPLDAASPNAASPPPVYWTAENTPQVMRTNLPRLSHCALEIDVCARAILNPRAVEQAVARATAAEQLFDRHPRLVATAQFVWHKQAKLAQRHAYAWTPPPPLMSDRRHRRPPADTADQQRALDQLAARLATADLTQQPSTTSSQQLSSDYDEQEAVDILGAMVVSSDDDDEECSDKDDDREWQAIADSSQQYRQQMSGSVADGEPLDDDVWEVSQQTNSFVVPQLDGMSGGLLDDELSSDDPDAAAVVHTGATSAAAAAAAADIDDDPILPVDDATFSRPLGRFKPFIQRQPASFVSRFSDHLPAQHHRCTTPPPTAVPVASSSSRSKRQQPNKSRRDAKKARRRSPGDGKETRQRRCDKSSDGKETQQRQGDKSNDWPSEQPDRPSSPPLNARRALERAMRSDVVFPHGRPAVDPGQWLSPARQPPEPDNHSASGTAAPPPPPPPPTAPAPPMSMPLSRELLTVLSLEVLPACRPGLLPDPKFDQVLAVCYLVRDYRMASILGAGYADLVGLLVVGELPSHAFGAQVAVDRFASERELFAGLEALLREYDPDVLLGYEVELSSFAYLIERGLPPGCLSRLLRGAAAAATGPRRSDADVDDVAVPGRILINLWRVMRSHVALRSYTLSAVVAAVLDERLPDFDAQRLADGYRRGGAGREHALGYLLARTACNLRLLDARDLLNRTCEQARVFGIDFSAVLTRGSQYRVESVLFRLAKLLNMMLPSPSRANLRAQKPVVCQPLVMEPHSRFYTDPVVVLDFQSLYPSIMIAYNLCYSTCLGALRDVVKLSASGSVPLGALPYHVSLGTVKRLLDAGALFVSANGVLFVRAPDDNSSNNEGRRMGVLPRLLVELLEARVMVKTQLGHANAEHLRAQLDACQTALKMFLNVTYGYTGAVQTGRMPCADLADSIVAQARATLEAAVRLVERQWPDARVVYGDTDSLFVQLPGRSRRDAFAVGAEIAARVTAACPAPVKLQFEKVYQPCVLVTKKHYAGWAYSRPDQTAPVFDAKGIETVRRDSCALVSDTLRAALDLYFRSADVERVRLLVQRTFARLLLGKIPLDRLFTARELRLGSYKPGKEPAHARLCQRLRRADPRRIPLYAQRVPYLVVCIDRNARLADAVRAPHELLADPSLRINCAYYIEKQLLPPLCRVFALQPAAVDPRHWYRSLPRALLDGWYQIGRSSLIASYFLPTRCSICKSLDHTVRPVPATPFAFCPACLARPNSYHRLATDQTTAAARLDQLRKMCSACAQTEPADCVSLDCPAFFARLSLANRLAMQTNACSAFLQLY